MDPVFCLSKIEILSSDHIISCHRSNPDEIDTVAKKEPVNIIIDILSKYPDGCASSRDIERTIGYLFGSAKERSGGLLPKNCWLKILVLLFLAKRMNLMS